MWPTRPARRDAARPTDGSSSPSPTHNRVRASQQAPASTRTSSVSNGAGPNPGYSAERTNHDDSRAPSSATVAAPSGRVSASQRARVPRKSSAGPDRPSSAVATAPRNSGARRTNSPPYPAPTRPFVAGLPSVSASTARARDSHSRVQPCSAGANVSTRSSTARGAPPASRQVTDERMLPDPSRWMRSVRIDPLSCLSRYAPAVPSQLRPPHRLAAPATGSASENPWCQLWSGGRKSATATPEGVVIGNRYGRGDSNAGVSGAKT